MKRAGIIISIPVLLFIFLFFIFTTRNDNTPFYEQAYYAESQQRIDSLKKNVSPVSDQLHAGFAKVNITPRINAPEENHEQGIFQDLPLAGYGDRKGSPAAGVNDSIFVKAVALKTGSQLLVLISADLLIMPPEITAMAADMLTPTGITRDMIVFSATHTHSSLGAWGGGFVGKQFAGAVNQGLKKWLALKITEAVKAAVEDIKPAISASGSFDAGQYTRNRLIGDKGTKNDDFSFIVVEQPGYKKAVIGTFAAHSTTLGADNMKISGDYPGFWAARLEQSAIDYALFMAGSMGSQSPVTMGEGFEKPRYLGEALADSLLKALDKIQMGPMTEFSYVPLRFPLPDYHFRITTNRNLSSYLSRKMMPHPGTAWLQAFRLGSMVWIATPADFSGEYALQVKNMLAAKGFESNVTGFNGTYVGYIIPGRYYYLNKYEPKTMGWFGPGMGDYTVELIRQITEIVTTK